MTEYNYCDIHETAWSIETSEQYARRAAEARMLLRIEKRRRAEARATDLLLAHLDAQQRADYERSGCIYIVGPSGYGYVISASNVLQYKRKLRRWWIFPRKVRQRWGYARWMCIQDSQGLPKPDLILAKKLAFELREEESLATANKSSWLYRPLEPGHLGTVDDPF
jgi:hypothetical protein